MSKKDFELIAEVIAGYKTDAIMIPKYKLVDDLCMAFTLTEPHFDADKFRKACGC